MIRVVVVPFVSWVVGVATYVGLSWPSFGNGLDALGGLVLYGAMFAAVPAFCVFWLVCLPLMLQLGKRIDPDRWLLTHPSACTLVCLLAATLLNSVPPTSSGVFSSEALQFYLVFAAVGTCLGIGYAWSARRSLV